MLLPPAATDASAVAGAPVYVRHRPERALLWQIVDAYLPAVPYPLRFLFNSRPDVMGRVLAIVHRAIATHLIRKAGFTQKTTGTGAVTQVQRFGSALSLNIH